MTAHAQMASPMRWIEGRQPARVDALISEEITKLKIDAETFSHLPAPLA